MRPRHGNWHDVVPCPVAGIGGFHRGRQYRLSMFSHGRLRVTRAPFATLSGRGRFGSDVLPRPPPSWLSSSRHWVGGQMLLQWGMWRDTTPRCDVEFASSGIEYLLVDTGEPHDMDRDHQHDPEQLPIAQLFAAPVTRSAGRAPSSLGRLFRDALALSLTPRIDRCSGCERQRSNAAFWRIRPAKCRARRPACGYVAACRPMRRSDQSVAMP
jgi:hypothetical protein